jgi:hypothetical protein
MVLWLSRGWIAGDPDSAAAARAHLDLRLGTTATFYTLADLGHVAIDGDPGFATRSLLRSTFVPAPRHYLTPNQKVVDFDERYPFWHDRALSH